MDRDERRHYRQFLTDNLRLSIDFHHTDQNMGVEPPPLQKPPRDGQALLPLAKPEDWTHIGPIDLLHALQSRRSHRRFLGTPLTLEELSFLLWATQGIREILHPGCALRTVPSAGCRHSFETYLLVSRIDGLASGLYRYLPVEHALVVEREIPVEALRREIVPAVLHQGFVAEAPVTFVWTAIPYRMEWRYDLAAHRVILLDAGHLCQNLYLASEAVSAGTCAIAAYHQGLMDRLLGVDGDDEFTVYLAPVGKVAHGRRGE